MPKDPPCQGGSITPEVYDVQSNRSLENRVPLVFAGNIVKCSKPSIENGNMETSLDTAGIPLNITFQKIPKAGNHSQIKQPSLPKNAEHQVRRCG
jgi:hypothetical protein